MQLCDKDIHKALFDGEIGFVGTNEDFPFSWKRQVQPASIDLRLGDIIGRFKSNIDSFDVKNTINTKEHMDIKKYEPGEPIIVSPNEIIYGQIYEQMWIGDNYSARVEGRSRVARLGLFVHCTGSYINPGFCGAMPLQIINMNPFPITIYPYIDICQLVVFQISDTPLIKYSEHSRILNPYFDETVAGPSVLKPTETINDNNISVVEKRTIKLIEDYYIGLQGKRKESLRGKNKNTFITTIEKVASKNIIEGDYVNMRDTYNIEQAGNVGPNAGEHSTIYQNYAKNADIDFSKLLNELEQIKAVLKDDDNEDADILIGKISSAKKSIKQNQEGKAIEIIKTIGKNIMDIAVKIGCPLIVKIITEKIS